MDMESTIKASALKDKWDSLTPLLRKSVRAQVEDMKEAMIPVGASKLGGHPDMPEGQEWPCDASGYPLAFVGQVDFKETAAHDESGLLPKAGLACFFYSLLHEPWGFEKEDADKFKVLYFDVPRETLRRHEAPEEAVEDVQYATGRLSFGKADSLPSWSDGAIEKLLDEKELDAYGDLMEKEAGSKLLGYSDNIQGEMEAECASMKGKGEWKLLFQIASEEEIDMMWGDGGMLYYWIKEEDLRNKRFDDAWVILQCH